MVAVGIVVRVLTICCTCAACALNDCGPAGGVLGSLHLAKTLGHPNVITTDMGGTSFDICVIKDGEIPTTIDSWVGEHRVAIKMVEVPTVGAGGGSLAGGLFNYYPAM